MARRTAGIQAQEPRAARLQFRARSRSLRAADVDRARVEERSLLRAWLMRGTVHLIPSDDAGWMLPLFAPPMIRRARKRLADFGLDRPAQDRATAAIHRMIDEEGPLTRTEVTERLQASGLEASVEAKYHLWALVTLDGDLCLGPDRGRETCLVRTSEWVGPLRRLEWADSLAELASRYLAAFGPASDRDFAYWAGLSLRDCRTGLERIGSELVEVVGPGETLLALRNRLPRAPRSPLVRLLGAYDTYLLGYRSRDYALAPAHAKRILPGGGILRPTLCVDGRLVGTWSSKRSGQRLQVTIDAFERLSADIRRAVASEVEDIGVFEGVRAELAAL